MNKKIIISAIVAAIVIPFSVYALSPLFINTTIDEKLPETALMTESEKDMMESDTMMEDTASRVAVSLSGTFVGVGDGIHDAQGHALVVPLEDGQKLLRLEDFSSTNGPDLYVYLASDSSASDYVSLGRLKANNGNQNYDIPAGFDLSKYDTVLIWCKQFSVLFGSAELT
ncbi:MAG: DM13 domain-containing protein [Thaumarchaeota archaeon]|nr:DM13 domain-containing protein [Nitrososphaerota archaeon]